MGGSLNGFHVFPDDKINRIEIEIKPLAIAANAAAIFCDVLKLQLIL